MLADLGACPPERASTRAATSGLACGRGGLPDTAGPPSRLTFGPICAGNPPGRRPQAASVCGQGSAGAGDGLSFAGSGRVWARGGGVWW